MSELSQQDRQCSRLTEAVRPLVQGSASVPYDARYRNIPEASRMSAYEVNTSCPKGARHSPG